MTHVWGGSGGRVQGVHTLSHKMTCSVLIQLVFCQKKTMWVIGVEVEQETSAPPPKKKFWIRPCMLYNITWHLLYNIFYVI